MQNKRLYFCLDSEVGESERGHAHRRPLFFEVLNQGSVDIEGSQTKPKSDIDTEKFETDRTLRSVPFFSTL